MTVGILAALPFLWAIVIDPSRWNINASSIDNMSSLATRAVLAFIARGLVAALLLGFIVSRFASALTSLTFFGLAAMAIGIMGFKNFAQIYEWIEGKFCSHLNEKELKRLAEISKKPPLAPWDAHLCEMHVHPDSDVVGKTLSTLALREAFGITIALIERGSQQIIAPRRDTILMPHDKVFVIATDSQLDFLANRLKGSTLAESTTAHVHYGLSDLVLTDESQFVGKTIRESGLREATDGLVVGIERGEKRMLNPDSLTVLEPRDRLWIVGNTSLIRELVSTP
jgi:CPA2 family monovalent cation:H+ antiporter-2